MWAARTHDRLELAAMAPAGSLEQTAEAAAQSATMKKVAAVGLLAFGVVHVLVGGLALSIAWGGGDEEASASGAFATLAEQPFGTALLWVSAVGLVGLAIWQASEAIWGYRHKEGAARVAKQVTAGAKAGGFLLLAIVAARIAMGSSSGGGDTEEGLTAKLLSAPAGQFLVGAVGIGILGVAVYLLYRGATKAFAKHLGGHASPTAVRLGQVGHVAKSVAYGIIGVLVITAAVKHNPEESGGLDEALTKLRDQPYGQWLLTAVALGLVAYGLYAFVWARQMKDEN
jgi:hypothetical protein